jgi:hypothetical protein
LALWLIFFRFRYTFGAQEVSKKPRQDGAVCHLIDSDLFDPYDRLIRIEVLGRRVEVPEKNTLLRCFQFLSVNTISYGDFCWNGDCTNCQVWYRQPGETPAQDRTALSCRFRVTEGLVVTRLSRFIEIEGINKQTETPTPRESELSAPGETGTEGFLG